MAKLYWHFAKLNENGNPILRDGTPLEIGKTYRHEGYLMLCPSYLSAMMGRGGYHVSTRAIDALRYAPGPYVTRVQLGGERITGGDKIVARERTAVAGVDATEVLRDFFRRCDDEAVRDASNTSQNRLLTAMLSQALANKQE